MIKKFIAVLIVLGTILLMMDITWAIQVQQEEKKTILFPEKSTKKIKIDGNLDDEVWINPFFSPKFVTCSPAYGQELPENTEIRMAYDKDNLYFAFTCYDEQDKIKTSLSPRDKISNDDYVAIFIDTMGNKQTSYEFYVNPSGIQWDGLNSTGGKDDSVDFVWHSAAKIYNDCYKVEIAIPLESIRFKGGKEVKMGLLLQRSVNHSGSIATWPETGPGQTDFNYMATVIYKDLKPKLKFEILPNFTFNRENVRTESNNWEHTNTSNLGVSVQYGITSSILAEATINPDFSQIESDEFQIEVNQKYPILYSEKRPFFMEGMGAFDFGLVQNGMMLSAVHTRNIIDPSWAAKVTGSEGKLSFAVLAAADQSEGKEWSEGVNPNLGKDIFWGIVGGKYNIGSDNSIGFLYSGRHFAGSKNDVVGLDLQYRFFTDMRMSISYLSSGTKESSESSLKAGSGINAMLQYSTPLTDLQLSYERYDENFLMQSAFQYRSNFSKGMFIIGHNLFRSTKSIFRRIYPIALFSKLHDYGTGMDDSVINLGVNTWFKGTGYMGFEYLFEKESWMGTQYDKQLLNVFARLTPFKWLFIRVNYFGGDQIYYGPEKPFLGTGRMVRLRLTLQPSVKLNMALDIRHDVLYTKPDHQKYYSVDIVNLQTTYQFNKYLFIRGALRYDNYRDILLTDFLASFTLIPGTVVHLGYGSLYEKRELQDDLSLRTTNDLTNTKNGLFFKVSYLWRIK